MSWARTDVPPEVFYGKLSMVPGLLLLLRGAPHVQKVEVIGERQFYDRVYRVKILLGEQCITEEVVRDIDESFLAFVHHIATVKTREELLALDQRNKIYYD